MLQAGQYNPDISNNAKESGGNLASVLTELQTINTNTSSIHLDTDTLEVLIGVTNTSIASVIQTEDAVHSSGDKGIMALSVRCDDICASAGADGDYQALSTNEHGILRAQTQQHYHIDDCGATTGWTVLGNDTTNLATTTNHVLGTLALEFDKVDGAANTVFAGIQKTLTSIDLDPYHKGGGFICSSLYVSSVADVNYVFIRLGTDSSNYNEWRVDEDELSAGWNCLKVGLLRPDTKLGNGWNSAAVTYVSVGVAFNAETNTLADIAVDHIAVNTGIQTTATILQETTPNINLLKVGSKVVNTQAGNVGTGTQRITIATDDVNLAAIKTATEAVKTINKTYAVALTHQAVTHPNTVVGSALDVSTKLAMTLLLFHASVEAAANTNPGKFLVQVSGLATGNEDWVTVYTFDATVSTADTEAMTATEPVGETDLAVAAIAGFAANDLLYIQDAGTVADGEWARCRETAAGHIHLVDGLTNEKDSSDVIWNDADLFTCSLDLTAIARVRVLFQCEGNAGANCHIKGMVVYGDSIN